MTALALVLAFLFGYAAWALLALSQPAHRESVALLAGRRAPRPRWMQGSAALCAGVCVALCVRIEGWSFGLLLWMGIVCTTALATTLTLTCLRSAEERADAAARNRGPGQPT